MKLRNKFLALVFGWLFGCLGVLGQATPPTPDSFSTGIAYAPNFAFWSNFTASAITASGSQAVLMRTGLVSTPDGIFFTPFVVGGKINLGSGTANAEIVTITAVSGCNFLAQAGSPAVCTVTFNPSNTHSLGETISSADAGIMEATGFVASVGGGEVYFIIDCGQITLNTGGLTTTSTCFVPNLFYNQGSSSRVTTTITVTASWAVGVVGATSAFSTANSTLTSGTTAFANQGTGAVVLATGATSAGLTALLITGATSNPGAGVVHSKVWGFEPVQSNF